MLIVAEVRADVELIGDLLNPFEFEGVPRDGMAVRKEAVGAMESTIERLEIVLRGDLANPSVDTVGTVFRIVEGVRDRECPHRSADEDC